MRLDKLLLLCLVTMYGWGQCTSGGSFDRGWDKMELKRVDLANEEYTMDMHYLFDRLQATGKWDEFAKLNDKLNYEENARIMGKFSRDLLNELKASKLAQQEKQVPSGKPSPGMFGYWAETDKGTRNQRPGANPQYPQFSPGNFPSANYAPGNFPHPNFSPGNFPSLNRRPPYGQSQPNPGIPPRNTLDSTLKKYAALDEFDKKMSPLYKTQRDFMNLPDDLPYENHPPAVMFVSLLFR
ncbi:uncharacterized protein LOC126976043 [Leptidea sinapis]|uniref:uncharacterized protein LOC126976043 n=1 Tax=Leptidea sinapis TaxID=189913 RepID=UPI0021C4299D|nr:uncharacterized protein LOC126976043 [Leptidea sinapis]